MKVLILALLAAEAAAQQIIPVSANELPALLQRLGISGGVPQTPAVAFPAAFPTAFPAALPSTGGLGARLNEELYLTWRLCVGRDEEVQEGQLAPPEICIGGDHDEKSTMGKLGKALVIGSLFQDQKKHPGSGFGPAAASALFVKRTPSGSSSGTQSSPSSNVIQLPNGQGTLEIVRGGGGSSPSNTGSSGSNPQEIQIPGLGSISIVRSPSNRNRAQ